MLMSTSPTTPTTPDEASYTYDDALRITHREAKLTGWVAVIITLFFWGSLWLTKASELTWQGWPLWFLLSVVGGFILSVLAVVVLVKCTFKRFSLDLKPQDTPASEHAHERLP